MSESGTQNRKKAMMTLARLVVAAALLALPHAVDAFTLVMPASAVVKFRAGMAWPRQAAAAVRNDEDDFEDGDDEDFTDTYLTAAQVKILRKEAVSRRRQKKLATFFMAGPAGGTGASAAVAAAVLVDTDGQRLFAEATIAAVQQLLSLHELVDVRSISRENVKQVRATAEDFADALGDDVLVLAVRGFSAVLYQPKPEAAGGVRLWRRADVFVPKMKPVRDSRGFIIPGEYE